MNITDLKQKIDKELSALSNDFSLKVIFLNTNEEISVNADKQFWAASVIKVPISCEIYRQVDEGKISLDQELKIKQENQVQGSGVIKILEKEYEFTVEDLIKLMLAVSDNTATNELVDLIGWESVEKYTRQLGLKDTTFKHKMMIKAGRGPNLTTAEDMATLFKMLYNKETPGSEEILEILNETQDRLKIPRYIPNKIKISHKTGNLPKAVHDVGIVFAKNPFVFSFLSDDQADKEITVKAIANCAKLCFDYAN